MQLNWNKGEIATLADYLRKVATVYDGIVEEMDDRNVDSIVAPLGTPVHWINKAVSAIVMKQKPAVEKGLHEAELIRDNPKYKAYLPEKRPRTKNGKAKTAAEVLDVVLEHIDEIHKAYPKSKKRR